MLMCCGEALIDMIESRGADGRVCYSAHVGGAIFNTAIALGRLRVSPGFLSGLSQDMFGIQLLEALKASHVDVSHVILSDRPATLAFVQLTDGHAVYTFYDENTAGRMLEPSDLPDIPESVNALYFGGISLISEPCGEFYSALAAREAADRVIALDPNIRPGFIQDEARYRARLEQMLGLADIVKVSDEDLHWIVPGAGSLAEKIDNIRAKGPKLIILTKGSAGASAWLPSDEEISVAAQRVEMVDTVGAGDTFNAGVLAHLQQAGALDKATLGEISPNLLRDALAFGTRVAGVTVSRAGANPPWAQELE
ncbi:carbohydrate kinase family protein [Sedimentitalea todarodis]|uniref:Carbohydrate kinase n=1 Tax=Sedimentitalea todarodis TaxID=1631240 RepID=A0ABU3VIT0_9RHOB|nr:carbohydrate kinase [Sedimentitalea todarodis]MDU9006091.1 carbohydrate kinase [Sedimentitalea todarodis]